MGGSFGICGLESRAIKGLAKCDKAYTAITATDMLILKGLSMLQNCIAPSNPSPLSELLN